MTNEELVLAIQADQDRQQNIEKLYSQNTGLLKMICNKLSAATGYEFEDLLQQSFFGLVKAAKGWQPDREANFVTYAFVVIKRELQSYIDETGSLIRKPEYEHSLIFRYKKFITAYQQEHSVKPSDFDICNYLDIPEYQLQQIRTTILISELDDLDRKISEDLDITLGETVSDPSDAYEDAEKRIIQGELAELIWEAVSKLKQDQQTVIKEHYAEDKTITAISKEKGWSYDRTRKEHRAALRSLRHRYLNKLQPYADIYGIGMKGTSLNTFNITWTSSTEYAALKLLEGITNNDDQRH